MAMGENAGSYHAIIKVLGVGGGGSNAVNRMIQAGVRGVEFIAVNTDTQALARSEAPTRIHIGEKLTRGLGAGGNPNTAVGRESAEQIADTGARRRYGVHRRRHGGWHGHRRRAGHRPDLQGAGGTDRRRGDQAVHVRGPAAAQHAEEGIAQLRAQVDTLITIPNDRLLEIVDRKTALEQAFREVDDVLRQGIQGISELITEPG